MKFTKQDILFGAFKVFMKKGYEGTTISLLQKELSMSRGAMYRHFDNKDELYRAVVEEYVFRTFERALHGSNMEYSANELIQFVLRKRRQVIRFLIKEGMDHLWYLNYVTLVLEAAKFYVDFEPRFKRLQHKIINGWVIALEHSIELNEVRNDIDTKFLACIFYDILMGDLKADLLNVSFADELYRDAEEKNIGLLTLYKLIKK